MSHHPKSSDALMAELVKTRRRLDENENPFSGHLAYAHYKKVRQELVDHGEEALGVLERALRRDDLARRESAGVLSRMEITPKVVEALVAATENGEPRVCVLACQRLCAAAVKTTYGSIAAKAGDHRATVASAAVRAAFAVDPERALGELVEPGLRREPSVRAAVVEQLREHGEASHIPLLETLLVDKSQEVRRHAHGALARLDPYSTRKRSVAAYTSSPDPTTRLDALAALAGVCFVHSKSKPQPTCEDSGPPFVAALEGASFVTRRLVVDLLRRAEDRPSVVAALDGPAGSLEGADGRRTFEYLSGLSLVGVWKSGDTVWSMKRLVDIVEAGLAEAHDVDAALAHAFASGHGALVLEAVKIVERLADPKHAALLARAHYSGHGEKGIVRALGALGASGLDALFEALSGEPRHRLLVARRMSTAGIEGTRERVLAAIAEENTPGRMELIKAFPLDQEEEVTGPPPGQSSELVREEEVTGPPLEQFSELVREHLVENYPKAEITDVMMEVENGRTRLKIWARRPGFVIGKQHATLNEIKKWLEEQNDLRPQIAIIQVGED